MTALPPSLDHFGDELESAVRRDLGNRRRRRHALRGGALLAAATAVALGVLSALPNGGPSVVKQAAAALAADDSILHYQLNAEQQNGDGTIATWHSETWQLLVAPYTRRQIQVNTDSPRAESVTSRDSDELYDASNDTIYVTTQKELVAARMPKIEIVSKSKLEKLTGSDRAGVAYLMKKHGGTAIRVIATKQGATRLRQRLAHGQSDSGSGAPEDFRSDILAMLRSGRLQVVGPVAVDGHDAIKLESLNGKQTYIVDAATYDPIEWTTTGTTGGVTLRFPVYEKLHVDGPSMALLDLRAQHPGAQVVRDVKAYMAAESRLYPHG